MLYRIVQCWIRLGLLLFCRKISFNNRKILKQRGPLLLALNHPNSFLDAILIGSHFRKPVHFLTRGDAFRNPLVSKLLSALKMVPIYRLAEGREYLALNDATFDRCREILLNGGIVLIFAEGLCMHQWQLRNLKKGAARIAFDAWAQPVFAERFIVQPVSLNYDSFSDFGKRVIIHFDSPISKQDLEVGASDGERVRLFNQMLSRCLKEGMIEEENPPLIVPFLIRNMNSFRSLSEQLVGRLRHKQEVLLKRSEIQPVFLTGHLFAKNVLKSVMSLVAAFLLTPFAIIGWLLNAPLFFSIRIFVRKKTSGTVFYDSVLFGSLLLSYPIYWLMVNLSGLLFFDKLYLRLILLAMPLFAWLLLIWKDKLSEGLYFLSLSEKYRNELTSIFD